MPWRPPKRAEFQALGTPSEASTPRDPVVGQFEILTFQIVSIFVQSHPSTVDQKYILPTPLTTFFPLLF